MPQSNLLSAAVELKMSLEQQTTPITTNLSYVTTYTTHGYLRNCRGEETLLKYALDGDMFCDACVEAIKWMVKSDKVSAS